MFYADDPKENPDPLMSKLKSFIDDIRIRMERNFLKLNYSKTEYGSSVNFSNLPVLSVTMGYCKIPIASSVKNLGVMLDRLLNMDNFVKSKARNINMNFSHRMLAKFKPQLSLILTTVLVYCMGLFTDHLIYQLPSYEHNSSL